MNRPGVEPPIKAWVRALANIGTLSGRTDLTLPGLLDSLATTHADQPALIDEVEHVSYAELARRARQYARWALAQAIRPGDVVAVLLRNRAEYPAIWLGITRVGGIVALLNTTLVAEALAHAIRVAAPAHLIAGAEFLDAVEAVPPHGGCQRWIVGGPPQGSWRALDRADHDPAPLDAGAQGPASNRQTALLIYTSGTTGLPKAARLSHARVLEWSFWFAGMLDAGPADRLYDCLPLYHSTGGVVGIGAMLVRGGAVVIRERFSASRFWPDVAAQGCTLFLYIGELCRYLLAAPADARDGEHGLRLCVGNGLRGDIWEGFAARFAIPRILEFYASTEGNVSLYNCEGRPGAIGRVPSFLAHRFPVALIACDAETGAPRRGPDGLCVRCAPDEAGEAVGRIDAADGASAFEGYTDATASQGKVLRDVLAQGDAWFRTGDLMRRDAAGFFYFVDRLGDTFRWKGENVSTTQVAEAVCGCPGVREAVVYGVTVPGAEGRAGMAAIVTEPSFGLDALHAHLTAALPHYARPLFVRVCGALDTTGTFKPVKVRLLREGYDPGATADKLYFSDPAADGFVELDAALYERLRQATIRL